jgi:Transposase
VVGVETDRGLLVGALVAAGYQVYAINPRAVDRYRDRHGQAGAKSDAGDARVLADPVRTDRHRHRRVAGDSELAEAIKIPARSHQNLIWTRQRLAQLRTLWEFYPAALAAFAELASPEALAVLAVAPTPARGRNLTIADLADMGGRAGRRRELQAHAEAIHQALQASISASPSRGGRGEAKAPGGSKVITRRPSPTNSSASGLRASGARTMPWGLGMSSSGGPAPRTYTASPSCTQVGAVARRGRGPPVGRIAERSFISCSPGPLAVAA